jgi:hypothetical protein
MLFHPCKSGLDRSQVPFLSGIEVYEHPLVLLRPLLYFVVAKTQFSQNLMGGDQSSALEQGFNTRPQRSKDIPGILLQLDERACVY